MPSKRVSVKYSEFIGIILGELCLLVYQFDFERTAMTKEMQLGSKSGITTSAVVISS